MRFDNLSDLLAGASIPAIGIVLVLGLVNCFLGYRIFRIMLAVYGFVLGAGAGMLLAGVLLEGEGWAAIAVALIAGLIGAALMAALYYVGVFVVGAVAGAMFLGALGASLDIAMPVVAILTGAVLLGIAAVFLQRVVLILATAFSGAWLAAMAGSALVAGSSFSIANLQAYPLPWQRSFVPLIIWLVLGVSGAMVQFRISGD